jgi:ABC-type glycerol-3-phosphate transport system substrate-binding protein
MRVLHWLNQNNAPLGSDQGVPSANLPNSAATWAFHNQLMATSSKDLIQNGDAKEGYINLFSQGVIALMPGWAPDAYDLGQSGVNVVAIPFPVPPGGKSATIVIGNEIISPLKHGNNPDLAINLTEEAISDPMGQAFRLQYEHTWSIPALKSLLEQYPTYAQLGGFPTATAKTIVRQTMKTLLDGGGGPVPGWPKNSSQVWAGWNNEYNHMWSDQPGLADIQKELDSLQATITGLIAKGA